MKPWFIQEDNVIPFRKKDTSVVRLPNVNAYPDFLTGVQDLQNHLKQGDISSDIHKKLYQDLIHRFMKVESFETPWFLREYTSLDQAKQEIIQKVQSLDLTNKEKAEENAKLLDKIYSILKQGDVVGRFGNIIKNALSNEYKENEMTTIAKMIADTNLTYQQKNEFLQNLQDDKVINYQMLKTPGVYTLDDVFNNDPKNFEVFKSLLGYGVGAKQKGKGEHAFAILSKKISVKGAGDINVNGTAVELKLETTTGGGRLGEPGAVPSQETLKNILQKYTPLQKILFQGINQLIKPRLNVRVFTDICNKLDPRTKKQLATEIFPLFFGKYASGIIDAFSKPSANPDEVKRQYIKANFDWYKDWMANSKGEAFSVLCIVSILTKKVAVISQGEDLINGTVKNKGASPYILTTNPRESHYQLNL